MENITGHGFYITIPMAVVTDEALTPNAKLTFGIIANLSNQRGYCFASNAYIGSVMNVHEITISRYVSELIETGWIIPFDEITKNGLQRRLALSEIAKGGLTKTLRGGKQKRLDPLSNSVKHNKQSETPNIKNKDERLEPDLEQFDNWSKSIIAGNDFYFSQKFKNEFPNWGGGPQKFVEIINDHLDLLNRYPKMNPNSQERFRNSLIKHFREYKSKPNGTGNKKGLDVNNELRLIADHIQSGAVK